MKHAIRLLAASASLLLWCSFSAQAGELAPLSLQEAKAQGAIIVDTRPSHFYQGWPMEGESQGGHVPGAVSLSADWKYDDEIGRAHV